MPHRFASRVDLSASSQSHSVCFAVISYAAAWLKAYYPAEFLCSVLNNYPMGFYTPRTVLNDARRFGLEVRPLDINLSGGGFTVEDETPASVWNTAGEPTPYDPFAQAWTADHDWGLTAADLAELEQEQNGEMAYADALRVAMEQLHSAEGAKSGAVLTGNTEPLAACLVPDAELPPEGAAQPARPHPPRRPPPEHVARPCGPHPRAPLPGRRGTRRLPRTLRRHRPRRRPGAPGRLQYLKQMGDRSLDRIEEERRHGPFASFEDFYLRTRIDYPVAENLIRVGAFDSLEPDRTELLWRLPLLHDRLEALAGSSGQRRGQLRAFYCPPSRAGLERSWSADDKVRSELELLGLTVTCHPLQLYEDELREMGVTMSYELPAMGDEVPVTVAGVYERAQNPWMRSGKRTMFLTLEGCLWPLRMCLLRIEARQDRPGRRPGQLLPRAGTAAEQPQAGAGHRGRGGADLEEVLARRGAPGTGTRAIPKKVG